MIGGLYWFEYLTIERAHGKSTYEWQTDDMQVHTSDMQTSAGAFWMKLKFIQSKILLGNIFLSFTSHPLHAINKLVIAQ